MRKLTPIDRLEALLMECNMEEFAVLCERVRTIERLRGYQTKTPRKPRTKKPDTEQMELAK